ncbi:MAG: hypothetical protein IJ247_01410 [Bacilli bacterium]|nr:hypothetical protein [Bacilli bacterium]
MIGLYCLIQTLVEKNGIPSGTYGVVVEIFPPSYSKQNGYYVELVDECGYPYEENTYHENEIRVLTKNEIEEFEKKTDFEEMKKERGW